MNHILNRNNDLSEFFLPITYFVKQQILENHTFPLWNNLFFSGTPLLPDPQSPLFYFPNIIHLAIPLELSFILLIILHTLAGAFGIYLLCKEGFGFSYKAALLSSFLYVFSPKLAAYLEAGHVGLIYSWAWIPFILFATLRLAKKPNFFWAVAFSIFASLVFFAHTVTFLILLVFSVFIFLFLVGKPKIRSYFFFGLTLVLIFSLTAVTLLPQLEWLPHTTRFLLLENRDVYPKWNGIREFLTALLIPWSYHRHLWEVLDTEKIITFGLLPSFLALIGFAKITPRHKVVLLSIGFLVLLLSLNNVSPIYNLLLSYDWYALMRVATRVWFILILAVAILAGYGFDQLLTNRRGKYLSYLLATGAIIEVLGISWLWLSKPISQETNFVPEEVYQYLSSDKEQFRVFCVTRCLSQKKAAEYGLELVEGYNTVQQTNYFKHSWQLMGGYWNYYTLSLPPIGTYRFEQNQPYASSLGLFNTKHVISSYKLTDENFVLEKQYAQYLVYQNTAFRERAYFGTDERKPGGSTKITDYSPNHIRVDTTNKDAMRLILAEVWSPGWKAYLDGKIPAVVQETPDSLRLVDIKPETQFVDFIYKPPGYEAGRAVTIITLAILTSYGAYRWKKHLTYR